MGRIPLWDTEFGGVMLREQLEGDPHWTPEQALCAAVLLDAYLTLHRERPSVVKGLARARLDVIKWLRSPRDDFAHSFVNICNHLRLNVEVTRRAFLESKWEMYGMYHYRRIERRPGSNR